MKETCEKYVEVIEDRLTNKDTCVLCTLYTKVCMVKAMVFLVVMYRCKSWTIKKAECWGTDVFKLWCWRRLKSPLDCKEIIRVNPKSTLNIHRKDWCWSWSSNNLATRCEQLTHWKRPWCWEKPKAEGEEGDRGWEGWIASPIQWTWTWANSRRWWGTGRSGVLQSMGVKESDMTWQLNNNKCTLSFGNLHFLWSCSEKRFFLCVFDASLHLPDSTHKHLFYFDQRPGNRKMDVGMEQDWVGMFPSCLLGGKVWMTSSRGDGGLTKVGAELHQGSRSKKYKDPHVLNFLD